MFYAGVTRSQEAKSIFFLFTGSWLIFPVLWFLGPNMMHVVKYDVVLIFFALGDIFAKNIFSYAGYNYTVALMEEVRIGLNVGECFLSF